MFIITDYPQAIDLSLKQQEPDVLSTTHLISKHSSFLNHSLHSLLTNKILQLLLWNQPFFFSLTWATWFWVWTLSQCRRRVVIQLILLFKYRILTYLLYHNVIIRQIGTLKQWRTFKRWCVQLFSKYVWKSIPNLTPFDKFTIDWW
jgi:hypothetical protein